MRKAERCAYIDRTLDQLYPNPPIPLRHSDPYSLLIAVMLSAQCTDARVNQVTPKLFALADNPADMAEQSYDDVYAIVRVCGLGPRKSRAILETSRLLCQRHGGQVPGELAQLEALPGVGHKTACVVLSQAFGEPQFPVDTHIHRLARRWRLSDGSSVVRTERDLRRLFPRQRWNHLHLQMIYYGREHCSARGCDGHSCPICSHLSGAGGG